MKYDIQKTEIKYVFRRWGNMSNTVINTNISAMNSHRALTRVGVRQARSSERLSTGLRINRAADDAAGLSISEKMRAQIRGLNQAQRNSQDGISLIQVAEGALQEMHNIAQRMRELTVQASNDTLDFHDRNAIGLEISTLTEELSNIIDRTEFNGISLLDHGTTGATSGISETIVMTRKDFCRDFAKYWASWSGWNEFTVDGQDPTWEAWHPEYYNCSCLGGMIANECPMCTLTEQHMPSNSDRSPVWWNWESFQDIRYSVFDEWLETRPELQNRPDIVTSLRNGWDNSDFWDCTMEWTILINSDLREHHGLYIQNGANANESLLIPLPNFNIFVDEDVAGPLVRLINSFEDLVLETHIDITAKLDDIDLAIGELSQTRAVLGATQNRLEHTINNLQIASENTSAAESRIRDTDMAKEMMRLTISNVLQQAATSMLAQANQAPQTVLQLLQ